jgi:predicted ATPase/DNA-binding SARP family transcriptional activator
LTNELSVRVLGPLEVWRDGERLRLEAAKPRALLALLLIRRSDVHRDVLLDALWGEDTPAGARNTLQVYVSRLRSLLGSDAITTTPAGYRLDSVDVDADRFEQLFAEGSFDEALDLWRGHAYGDLRYEAFAQAEAGRLEELRLACMEGRIEAQLEQGRHAAVVGELEALVTEHPLRERLRGQLILALYRSGRQSEALAQYQATRRMLADELGLEPSPQLRELERMILAHDPELAAPPSTVAPRTNLPFPPTPFVGREHELADLVDLMRSGRRRLVTLTGPGGSGKTRLALEAARRVAGDYDDGVWWVPLESLDEPRLVGSAVADACGAKEELADYVGERRILLLLDNFEQLLDAGPETAALLARCPNLMLLVTSREPLRVAAERDFRVPPMTVDDAVMLFEERAAVMGSEDVVCEICRRLDCLPLAVELAAARTRPFSPERILVRLDERLPLLEEGPRDAPVRQRTMRATIAWSHDLLSAEEQHAFRRLSVFAGGFTAASAEAVCDAATGLVEALVDRSLVSEPTSGDGEPRYSMLQTIWEYAAGELEASGERGEQRRRHAEHFCELFRRSTRRRVYGEVTLDDESDDWLADELPNLREALSFALREDLELALRLAAAGGTAWSLTGASREGEVLLRRVLGATEGVESRERAEALIRLGVLMQHLASFREAEELYEQARELAGRIGDRRGVLQAIINLIELGEMKGNLDWQRDLIEQALPMAEEVGSDFDRARVLFWAADLENSAGDYARADALLDEGLRIVRGLGLPARAWAWQLVNVGWIAMQRGDYERARSAFDEYLAGASSRYPIGIATAHGNLGLVALYEAEPAVAAEHFVKALELAREAATKFLIAECLHGMAAVLAIDGDSERAARLWGAARALKESIAVPLTEPEQFIVETFLEPLRATLDEEVFAAASSEGAAMTMDEAVAYALGEGAEEVRSSSPAAGHGVGEASPSSV